MQKQVQGSKALKFSDILITVMIAVVFGVIYKFWGSVYDVFKPLFVGGDEILYGMWFMAGPLAFLIIRKPGVALLAELAAANIEALLGSQWGGQAIVYGLIQGIGAEIVFALFRYRKSGVLVAALAGLVSGLGSVIVDVIYGYADFEAWMLVLKYSLRAVSSIVIAGVFAYYLVRALESTGVTKLVRPVAKEEYASLDK
jgi:energy-coupling factor transport system permease protein